MADEQDQPEEELLLDEPLEGDEPEQQDEGDQPEPANDDDGDEFAIEIEGDEPAPEETPLIKELRAKVRDLGRENAEFRKVNTPKIEVGPEPDLWDDCEGDPDKYKTALLAWTDRKAQAEKQDRAAKDAAQVKNQEFQRRFVDYRAKAASLPVSDFEDAEKAVVSALSEEAQSAIVRYTKDPSKVVYALAKHPARLNAIAQMGDLGDVIVAVTDMERSLKVVNKRKPPAPEAETIVTGSAQNSGSTDKMAEKLLSDAAKGVPGAMQKYRNHMKQKRAA